jgi:hypothetical protein
MVNPVAAVKVAVPLPPFETEHAPIITSLALVVVMDPGLIGVPPVHGAQVPPAPAEVSTGEELTTPEYSITSAVRNAVVPALQVTVNVPVDPLTILHQSPMLTSVEPAWLPVAAATLLYVLPD